MIYTGWLVPQCIHGFSMCTPLRQNNINLDLGVTGNSVHLYVVSIITKGILQLGSYSLNTIQSEDHQADNRNCPPSHIVHHCKWQNATEESEHLLLVNPNSNPVSRLHEGQSQFLQMGNWNRGQFNRFHPSVRIGQCIQLGLHLTSPGSREPPSRLSSFDKAINKECQLKGKP